MRPQDIQSVQQSFAGVFARKADLAERFYVHLYTRLPEARRLFRNDFVKQKTMLTAMVAACVKNLDDRRTLQDLGAQLLGTHAHLDLGVRETEAAWSRAISLVAGTMTRH